MPAIGRGARDQLKDILGRVVSAKMGRQESLPDESKTGGFRFDRSDPLARRMIRAAKHDPRWHATLQQVQRLPTPTAVGTFQPTGYFIGWQRRRVEPRGIELEEPPEILNEVAVEKSGRGVGEALAHELTHVLHEDALNRADRKAISLERASPPAGLASGGYEQSAEEMVARLGHDPLVQPPREAPQYIRRMAKLLRNLRRGELNPVRERGQIERTYAEPQGEAPEWAHQYLFNRDVAYPRSLNLQPSDQPSTLGRLARSVRGVLVGNPEETSP